MTYQRKHVRSGLTAIAAVLALSSTPLVAQDVTTPPDPVSEPTPSADPLAPETTTPEPVAAEPEAEPAQVETAAPATTRRAPARARTAAPARTAATAPVAASEATPATELPAEALAVPPGPMPIDQPIAAEPAPAGDTMLTDESLPIAGAAGLGLLALGGLGLALQRRRRRRDELEHFKANQHYLAEHPPEALPNDHQPAFVRHDPTPAVGAAVPAAAVIADAPKTKLPEGFDLSRFGRHVRAAYMGPTEDNPSLSLKYRLRRAAAMDQRARMEADKQPQAAPPVRRAKPAGKPMWALDNSGFMLRRSDSNGVKPPAYQK